VIVHQALRKSQPLGNRLNCFFFRQPLGDKSFHLRANLLATGIQLRTVVSLADQKCKFTLNRTTILELAANLRS